MLHVDEDPVITRRSNDFGCKIARQCDPQADLFFPSRNGAGEWVLWEIH